MTLTLDTTPLPQHLVLTGVTWAYYEHTLEQIGNRRIRVTFLDGAMEIIAPGDNPYPVDYLVVDDVSWTYYEETLKQIGDRPLRVTFCDGRMEIMSPLPKHERDKGAIRRLIETMSLELDITVLPLGSTTFRRSDQQAGLEPDECYYIQNEPRVREMNRFDPKVFPAPDLAIEVDITSRSIAREPIYARLRVPEIWRYHRSRLRVRVLGPDGTYIDNADSLAFPFLPMAKFVKFVHRMATERQNDVLREFRKWVSATKRKPREKP